MPVVVPADAEKAIVDVIHDTLIPSLPDLSGFTVGTVMAAGVSPKNYIRVRTIGGGSADYAERTRVDVMVWTDGTIGTEAKRGRISRLLMAHLRKNLRCKIFATPIPLPDPADPTKTISLFTVELLLKGAQS